MKKILPYIMMFLLMSMFANASWFGAETPPPVYINLTAAYGNSWWPINPLDFINASNVLNLNWTTINATINTYVVAAGNDSHVAGDGIYLYNDSTTMYFNESKLNETIGANDVWVNESGDNMTGILSMNTNNITAVDWLSALNIASSNYIYTAYFLDNFGGGAIDMTGDPWYLSGVDFEINEDLTVVGDTTVSGDLYVLGNESKINYTLLVENDDGNTSLIVNSNMNDYSCLYLTEGNPTHGFMLCNDGSGINRFVISNYGTGFEYMWIDRDDGTINFNNDTIFTSITVVNVSITGDLNISGNFNVENNATIGGGLDIGDNLTVGGNITFGDLIFGNGSQLTGISTVDTDTHVAGDLVYLYNDTTTMYFNESKLNITINSSIEAHDLWVNITGDVMTGNLNMNGNNFTNVTRLYAVDGSFLGFGNEPGFSGMDQAGVLASNQTLGPGVVTTTFIDTQGMKVIAAWQSGKNNSAGFHRNSLIVFGDLGYTNGSMLTNAIAMWQEIGITPVYDYDTANQGATLGVQWGVETQKIHIHDELGNGTFSGEGEYTWLGRDGTDYDIYNVPVHLKIPRQENVTFGIGPVTIFDIPWDGEPIGGTPTPFTQINATNALRDWSIRNSVYCFSNPCVRATGGDLGTYRIMDYNFSSLNISLMNLTFYYGSTNMDTGPIDFFEVQMNNNSAGASWVSLYVDNTTNANINPAEFRNFTVPVTMDNKTVVTVRFIHHSEATNEITYVDNVKINGTAGQPVIIELTRNDARIELGGNTYTETQCEIYYNDSSTTIELGRDPNCNVEIYNATFITISVGSQNISGNITADWGIFNGLLSNDWTNVTITESQISDLTPHKNASGPYLYNDTNTIYFNESYLNDTVSVIVSENASAHMNASGPYLYNDTTTIYFNESKLNETINYTIYTDYVPYTGAHSTVDLGGQDLVVAVWALFVDAGAGRVGVGTNNPQAEFHVRVDDILGLPALDSTDMILQDTSTSNDEAIFSIIGGNGSGSSIIRFGDSDNVDSGIIDYDHGNDTFFVKGNWTLGIYNVSAAYFLGDGSQLTGLPIGDNISGDLIYLYNDTDTMYFNESKLNDTVSVIISANVSNHMNASGPYLYNDTTTIYFNETYLNVTIYAISENDTHVAGDGIYLYNDTTTIYFNESKLNETINQTVFTGYVPYTGATSNVSLGGYNISAHYFVGNNLILQEESLTGLAAIKIISIPNAVVTGPAIYIDDTAAIAVANTPLIIKSKSSSSFEIYDSGGTKNIQFNSDGGMYLNFNAASTPFLWMKGDAGQYLFRADASDNAIIMGTDALTAGGRLAIEQPSTVVNIGNGSEQALRLQQHSGDSAVGARVEMGFSGWGMGKTSFSEATIGFITTSNAGHEMGNLYFATRNVTTNTAPIERMIIYDNGTIEAKNDLNVIGSAHLGNLSISTNSTHVNLVPDGTLGWCIGNC